MGGAQGAKKEVVNLESSGGNLGRGNVSVEGRKSEREREKFYWQSRSD
jgi:hypothetical protein